MLILFYKAIVDTVSLNRFIEDGRGAHVFLFFSKGTLLTKGYQKVACQNYRRDGNIGECKSGCSDIGVKPGR